MAGFCWLPYHHVLHRHTASVPNGPNGPDKGRCATSLATVVALRVAVAVAPLWARETIDVHERSFGKCPQDDEANFALILPHCVNI